MTDKQMDEEIENRGVEFDCGGESQLDQDLRTPNLPTFAESQARFARALNALTEAILRQK
jgi:hypothetical protein